MRALFQKKTRLMALVSLAFLTQCCCIVIPFGVEAQRRQQQESAQQPVVQQIVERIEAVVAFDR